MKRKIIIGITGASGHVYARNLIDLLLKIDEVEELALVFSKNGQKVWNYEETESLPDSKKIIVFENDNLFAAPSSGSAMYSDMIVMPCSMGSLARIASGSADNLIARAADVMMKERRKLILAVREAPFSLIHLRNMTGVTEAGAIIFPLSPFFYHHPKEIIDIVQPLNSRILSLLGLDDPQIKWK
jgi:4-hydroxy-3-polyprenylbenzoate decarboxylase